MLVFSIDHLDELKQSIPSFQPLPNENDHLKSYNCIFKNITYYNKPFAYLIVFEQMNPLKEAKHEYFIQLTNDLEYVNRFKTLLKLIEL